MKQQGAGRGQPTPQKRAFGSFVGMLTDRPLADTTAASTDQTSDVNRDFQKLAEAEEQAKQELAAALRENQKALDKYLAEVVDGGDDSDALTAFNFESCMNKGILDGGASRSVGGFEILDKLQELYNLCGKELEVSNSTVGFTFAGGEQASATSSCIIRPPAFDENPVGIHAVPRPSPILLGLDNLRHYELNIDYKYNTCWSHKLERFLPIEILPSGHMAIELGPQALSE